MAHIDFNNGGVEQHDCSAVRDGDWIIYRCPKCPLYERRYNCRTGEMAVRGADSAIRHRGVYRTLEFGLN